MPVALRASGMTEDTLVFQHKLSTRTFERGLASNKSDTVENDHHKRHEKPHVCVRGLSIDERKGEITVSTDAMSVQVRWRINMSLSKRQPRINLPDQFVQEDTVDNESGVGQHKVNDPLREKTE